MIKPRKILEEIKEKKLHKKKDWRLKLDENENIYACPQSIVSIAKNAKEADICQVSNCAELIKKFSKKYSIEENNILFSNNINEILRNIFDGYLEKEDIIACFKTNSDFINKYALINDIKALNFDDVSQLQKEVKIVYICTPNDITGEVIKASCVENLLKEFSETLFIFDCTYINFALNSTLEDYIELIKNYDNVAIIKSFEKDFAMVGVGFAFALANFEIINNISKISFVDINSIAINCTSIVLNDDKRVEEIRELNKNARELLFENLIQRQFAPFDSQANFILCDFKNYCEFYYEKLKQNGIITKNFPKNSTYSSCLRITIPTVGGVKFLCEILNKKDVLIFSDEVMLKYEKENDEFELLLDENTIKELSKNYDLVIYTKNEADKIKEFLKEQEIEKYFYYIFSSNSATANSDSLAKLKESCPYKKIKLISSNIENIIKANMADIKVIAVIMPEDDFNVVINNYRHLGVKNILGDYKNLFDFIAQLDNFNSVQDNFIIN